QNGISSSPDSGRNRHSPCPFNGFVPQLISIRTSLAPEFTAVRISRPNHNSVSRKLFILSTFSSVINLIPNQPSECKKTRNNHDQTTYQAKQHEQGEPRHNK